MFYFIYSNDYFCVSVGTELSIVNNLYPLSSQAGRRTQPAGPKLAATEEPAQGAPGVDGDQSST
uniref:Uncharacterized protein n=1 Tax=Oryza sativa subsp. japonica TaxID=39947 RepID=Q6ZJK8_ORYSJ|nr:hypothetical protein [Oryza sativa Japonica Group]